MTAAVILERLRRTVHPECGEWVVVEEAFRIDALALQCWKGSEPSWRRVGYEVKISRADFRRELAQPEKRAAALEIVDFFYFAVPAGLVQPGEVPAECGLVEVPITGWPHIAKKAPRLTPRELTRAEVAYLVRRRVMPYDRIDEQRELHRLRVVLEDRERRVEELAARVDQLEVELAGRVV